MRPWSSATTIAVSSPSSSCWLSTAERSKRSSATWGQHDMALPGLIAPVEVRHVGEPEVHQAGRSQAGGVPLVAHDDDATVVAIRRGDAVRARRVEAPFQDVAVDDDGAGQRAVARPLVRRAGVDD